MERSREGKRGASALRRLRISCPKDPADAEARMDETPLIEKFRKGNLQAFPVSFAAQVGSTGTASSKKKRHVLQETQTLLERMNGGNDSAERAEMAPSEEEDDEATLLPSFTPFGRSRSKERAKDDELVMDISNIPRRARSSGSRLSSLRRQLEPSCTDTSLQQAPTVYQQRSPSPNLLAKRPAWRKNRPLKDFRVMGSPQISDQEVEVAEVLFDLSRSTPSFVKSSKLVCQEKSARGMEDEDFDSSSSQASGSPARMHLQKSSCPPSDEPKSKRQRVSLKEEISVIVAAGVGPLGLDEHQSKPNDASEECRQKTSGEVMMDLYCGDSQLHVVDGKNANYIEQRSKEIDKAKVMRNNNAEHIFTQEDLVSPCPLTCKAGLCVQISCKEGEHSKVSTRSREDQQANGSRSKVDLVRLSTNPTTEDEGGDAMETDNKRLSLSESSSNFLKNGGEKLYPATSEKVSKGNNVLGPPAAVVENESSTGRLLPIEGNQQHLKHMSGQLKEEQNDFELLDVNEENDFKVSDHGARSACLPLCTSPSTLKSSSMSTGFPPWSIYAKAAPPWSTNAFFSGSSLDRKMSYPATQLPHTTAQPVLKMRRCATHVYVAHYIQQRQQFLRQTFWPPACHSGAAYNPSTFPANLQGKEQWSENNAYLPSTQAAESSGTRMPNSRGSVISNSVHGLSVGAGTAANLGHAMAYGTHGQYAHAMAQQNGCVSLYMPSSKSPGQNAPIFDKSFYHAHLSPLELQSPAQKTSSPSHPPRRQQVPPSSPHVGLSHPLLTQPHSQLKQQGQQEQQQHYTTIQSQYYGAGSDGFSGGDRMLNGKLSIQLHRQAQLQGQQAASPSDILPSHQLSRGPEVEEMNLVAEENGFLCKDRATGGTVQSDLATSNSAAKAHGGYDQQLQSLRTQHQQCYQRSYPRAPATLSTKSHYSKEQGSSVEGQSPIKQPGSSTDGSKALESHLPMSVATSTIGGPAPIGQATVFSLNGQLTSSHHIQKQAMASVKPATGANITAGVTVENAPAWGNLGKIPSSPRHAILSSQNVVKASHTSGLSNGSHPSLSPGQHVSDVWSNLQSVTNWLPHNTSASRASSVPFSSCAVPPSSSLKVAGSSALNNKFTGEGVRPALQGDVSRKTPIVGDPNSPSTLNSGEKLSSRVQAQPQGHVQGQTMFPQQQSMNFQQTRSQVYQQPCASSNKHEQSVHQPQSQQQSWPSQAQQLSPQLQNQSFTVQQSHLQKQLQSVPSNVTLSSGLLPGVTSGTTSQGKTNTGTSTGQSQL